MNLKKLMQTLLATRTTKAEAVEACAPNPKSVLTVSNAGNTVAPYTGYVSCYLETNNNTALTGLIVGDMNCSICAQYGTHGAVIPVRKGESVQLVRGGSVKACSFRFFKTTAEELGGGN